MNSIEEKRPNLIYVFADQLRRQSLGFTGDRLAQTPNIDVLSRESLELCGAVSGHPVCAPYRASLLTGKYTTSTGMVINEIRMNPDHHTFAQVLNENGYTPEYIGKWHMYGAQLGHHLNPANSFIPPGPDRLGFNGYFAAYNFHHEYYGESAYYHLNTPEKHYCGGYEPDVQVDLALERLKLRAKENRPFALFLSLGVPHDPWTAGNVPHENYERFRTADFVLPPNYLAVNDPMADHWAVLARKERGALAEWMRCYYAMVSRLDDDIGRLVAGIKKLDLENNTILIFTSDHGEMFGAHGRRAKNIFYDEAVRVPYLVRWPGVLKAGAKRDFIFNTVDIMPTLLTMMNLPVPAEAEGSDLSECLLGKADSDAGALMMGTGPTAVYGNGNEWRGLRTKRYTYAVYRDGMREFLFDNNVDPLQLQNIAGTREGQKTANGLKAEMYAKMKAIGDNFNKNSYYEHHWIRNRIIIKTAGIHRDVKPGIWKPETDLMQYVFSLWNLGRKLRLPFAMRKWKAASAKAAALNVHTPEN